MLYLEYIYHILNTPGDDVGVGYDVGGGVRVPVEGDGESVEEGESFRVGVLGGVTICTANRRWEVGGEGGEGRWGERGGGGRGEVGGVG